VPPCRLHAVGHVTFAAVSLKLLLLLLCPAGPWCRPAGHILSDMLMLLLVPHAVEIAAAVSCRSLVPPCRADVAGPEVKQLQQLHARALQLSFCKVRSGNSEWRV
jgi:hypothetical protein